LRTEAVEKVNAILDTNAPTIMQTMVDLVLDPLNHSMVRGNIGMKLLERLDPKKAPLINIDQRKTSYEIHSHLGLDQPPVKVIDASAAPRQLPSAQLSAILRPKPSARSIDASTITNASYPKFTAASPTPSSPATIESLSPESEEAEPFERAGDSPIERRGQRGMPTPKVNW